MAPKKTKTKKAATKRKTTKKKSSTKKTTRKKRAPKIDHVAVLNKALEEAGAKKLKDNYWIRNGWRIRINTRGVYWHTRYVDEFPLVFDGLGEFYEDKGNKPFTPANKITKQLAEQFIEKTKTKTRRLRTRETKAAKAEQKRVARRRPKRPWCKGCEFCPQGVDAKTCENLKWGDTIGHFYCSDNRWWEWNWCHNAERTVTDEEKPWAGTFTCKAQGDKPCPYQKPTITDGLHILSRDINGSHYTDCPKYDGHREKPLVTIESIGSPPPDSKPLRKKTKSKTKRKSASVVGKRRRKKRKA